MHDPGGDEFVMSEWTLRIEKVDGPTRRSSLKYGNRSAELPLIFNVEADPIGSGLGRGVPISSGWDGIEISIRNDPGNVSIPAQVSSLQQFTS